MADSNGLPASEAEVSVPPDTVQDMAQDASTPYADLKLSGGRFDHGGFPLAGMAELANYQRLLFAVARDLWRQANPGRRLPHHFDDKLNLSMTEFRTGSVVPVLARNASLDIPGPPDYGDLAVAYIEEAFARIVRENELPADISDAAAVAFKKIGSSLDEHELFQFRASSENPVKYSKKLRQRLLGHGSNAESRDGLVVGQIRSLDSFDKKFILRTSSGNDIEGSYADALLFEDLHEAHKLPDSRTLIRLACTYLYDAESGVQRIEDVDSVTPFTIDAARLSERLIALAGLENGWGDGEGQPVSLPTVEFVSKIWQALEAQAIETPAIFPTEEGGLQMEWVTDSAHLQVAVDPEVALEAYFLDTGTGEEEFDEPEGIGKLVEFVGRHSLGGRT